MQTSTARLRKLGQTLELLHGAGLKFHPMAALLTLYAGASPQYVLRLGAANVEQARAYDAQLRCLWGDLFWGALSATWIGSEPASP